MKVRDIRNPGWFWAQNELFDVFLPLLGVHGVAVYMAMCRLLEDPKTKSGGRLSVRCLAKASGVSKSEVSRARAEMVALGMIAEKAGGPNNSSVFELLDLRAAAEAGPEELKRQKSLSQRPEAPSVPEVKTGTPESVPAGDTSLQKTQQSCGSVGVQPPVSGSVPGTPVSLDGGHLAPGFNSLDRKQLQEREKERANLPMLAGLIVLAHPRAQMRGWTDHDVPYADRIAAIEAARAEAELFVMTPEGAALSILQKIERIAREVPRNQWRFLKEIDKFLRLREYRMQPNDLYRSLGGTHVRIKQNQHQPVEAQRSASAQRGIESRANIAAARERRRLRHLGAADGRDAGPVPEPVAPGGDAGYVPGGVGADGGPLRAR